MSKPRKKILPTLTLIILIGVLCFGGYLLYKDTTPPSLKVSPEKGFITYKTPIKVDIADVDSNIKAIKIIISQNNSTVTLLEKVLPEDVKNFSQEFSIKPKQLKQGNFELAIWAADSSYAGFGSGNAALLKQGYTLDTIAPTITAITTSHNIARGGTALIIYTVDDDVAKSGVKNGADFFEGYKQPDGTYACLFAMPYYTTEKDFAPTLVAEDVAGNTSTGSFWYHIINKRFRHDNINISDRFLKTKMGQFKSIFPDTADNEQLFLRVNRELRKKNRAELKTIGKDTSPVFLFEGKFKRLPGAATKAKFGDKRTYYHNGKKIDHQTHLGVDLASVRQAPVPAANNGKIVHAGNNFGIYGNAVMIDHGLGLQTLYSHLSSISVKEGDIVKKGQIIGRTGATGMAGGDHLHFGVICAGIPVNPFEWWDARWIKNNITNKLPK